MVVSLWLSQSLDTRSPFCTSNTVQLNFHAEYYTYAAFDVVEDERCRQNKGWNRKEIR